MARRIIVEQEKCEHGLRTEHLLYPPNMALSCPGPSRRVLDSNSFVDEVAHTVMAWTWTIDAVPDMESPIEGLDLAQRILDALVGGDPSWVIEPDGAMGPAPDPNIKHHPWCCFSRGCHNICSYSCGTDHAIDPDWDSVGGEG